MRNKLDHERNKFFTLAEGRIYIILFLIISIGVGYFKPILGVISFLIFSYLIYHTYVLVDKKDEELTKYVENLSDDFDSATKHAIFNMPFPLVMLNDKGSITWYNTPFLDMTVKDDILNKNIKDVIDLDLDEILDNEEGVPSELDYEGSNYLIYLNYINNRRSISSGERIILLYFVENTKYKKLEAKYDNEMSVVSLVYVDNYEDVKNNTPDVTKPLVLAEIDKKIRDYFAEYNSLVRKYENDKYLVIMNNFALKKIKERKFDLLDEMRELDIGNKIPITLSIGVSLNNKNFLETHRDARAAIDIALGRGGDQAVLNRCGTFTFFGGKSKALEKRNKVRARVIGYALKQLVDQADEVFVMGHKNADMDAIGSGIGVLRGISNVGKKGYLVLNSENPSIRNIMDKMRKEQPNLEKQFISSEKAEEFITKDSLMILVDNHKPSFTEAPELLEKLEKVVVIDHHRRGAEFVEDPVLTYLEPYASSASELVTEILPYMYEGSGTGLTKFEAEALLAGITVDTKNFTFQTGVRTFEAASVLKRAGADAAAVKELFKDDYDVFLHKADIVRSSEIIYDNIAIGELDLASEDSILIAAQAADELLDINGVEASFVLTRYEDKIHISGRSLGKISVQLILEELGGGGHLTSAGVQLSDVDLEEAREELKGAIKKHI